MNRQTKIEIETEELDKFQHFLFEMDDVLDDFRVAARTAGYQLNFTLDSIPLLEAYVLSLLGKEDAGRLKHRAAVSRRGFPKASRW